MSVVTRLASCGPSLEGVLARRVFRLEIDLDRPVFACDDPLRQVGQLLQAATNLVMYEGEEAGTLRLEDPGSGQVQPVGRFEIVEI